MRPYQHSCPYYPPCSGSLPEQGPGEPSLDALVATLADALGRARMTVDELAHDLVSERWQRLPPAGRRAAWPLP